MYRIPVYNPSLTGNEKKYVVDCLDTTWISSKGKYVNEFESRFSEYIGLKYSASVCNGTVALHLALLAIGIEPGDEVIVPTFTYIASVNAIKYIGAVPVFVDSLENTWQMDTEDVERKITEKTRAIMAVHLYGHPCEMDRICKIADEKKLYLVEDCAEAFGSFYHGRHVGSFGDVSTFSFFGNKTITTGEGGMVVTNNQDVHRRTLHLKGQGLAENREYWHDVIGYNYRMTNICAAIGLAQLEQADFFIEKKRSLAEKYRDGFNGMPVVFHDETDGVRHSYWMCSILFENSDVRDKARDYLKQAGVETRPLFPPVHSMPMYYDKNYDFPVAHNLSYRGINLPSWPLLSDDQIEYIIKKVYEGLDHIYDNKVNR